MKLKWLLGGALALALGAVAVAQTIATFNLTGSEVILGQLGPGGGSIYIPSYVLRSGANHTLVATGTTVTTNVPAASEEVLATGAITTWNVFLPTVAIHRPEGRHQLPRRNDFHLGYLCYLAVGRCLSRHQPDIMHQRWRHLQRLRMDLLHLSQDMVPL